MKKIIAILALATFGTAFAADYVSVDIDSVTGLKGASNSTAQYSRAGKSLGNYQFGVQSRTANLKDGGLVNSTEVTAANNKVSFAGITPFVGVGHDNGFNGANGSAYTYGLVGATAGMPIGPGFALVGVKARVGSDEQTRTNQTVAFATYSIPVSKNVSVNLNASKSYKDIRENALGLGLSFNF
jgi:hypothetical protein